MTTPQDPEEEPVGDELSDERADAGSDEGPDQGPGSSSSDPPSDPTANPSANPSEGLSREDALWQSIVENYGERPQIEDLTVEAPPPPQDLIEDDEPAHDDGDTLGESVPDDPEEHFVPPPPPPLPKPPPARLVAWLGLFGVPTFVLVMLVAGISLPSWFGLLLMGWFVGGFVFLVASMKPGSGEGTDDGARI